MSLDYCTGQLARYGNVAQSVIINGTYSIPIRLLYSKNFDWLVRGIQIKINTAAASASQYVALQSGATTAFSSPVEIARVTIASTDAAGTLFQVQATDAYARVPAGYFVRLVHVATSTDASLDYDYEIFGTARHE